MQEVCWIACTCSRLKCPPAQGQQQGALGSGQGGFAQQLGGGRVGMPGLHALQQGMAGGGGADGAPGGGGRAGFGQNPGDPAQNSSMLQGMAAAGGGGGGGISQDMMRFAAYQQQMREQAAIKARPGSPSACLPCLGRARLGPASLRKGCWAEMSQDGRTGGLAKHR